MFAGQLFTTLHISGTPRKTFSLIITVRAKHLSFDFLSINREKYYSALQNLREVGYY